MVKWFTLMLWVIAGSLLSGCVPGLPETAWQTAVSAVCSSPLVPGQNMCQGVRYIGYAELSEKGQLFPILKRTHEYCVVLNYIDFTGQTGTAWVQISGPNDSGDYQADGGPLFNQACAKVVQSP
jgi:hypothetical protein